EDDTTIAFTEDVAARYAAYGWHVQTGEGGEDVVAIEAAIEAAKAETGKPSIIVLRTVIGYPAPTKMNTGASHGAALGGDEVAATKKILGFDPEQSFQVDDAVIAHTRKAIERGQQAHKEWQQSCDAWAQANPENKKLYERLAN